MTHDQAAARPHPPDRLAWLRSSLGRNLLGVGGAALLNRLLGLATIGWAARHVGPEAYGRIGFGLSVTAYAAILLSPGFATWGTRAVARDRQAAGRLLIIVNGTQLLLATLGFAGVAAFATFGLANPLERTVVVVSALVLFTQALSADWVLNGLELVRYTAAYGVVVTALSSVGLLVLVRQPADEVLVPWLALATALVGICGGYWLLLRRFGLRPQRPTPSEVREAIVASLPLGALSAIVALLHYGNNFIVRGFLGERELGIFLAGFRLVELAGTLPSMLSSVFVPRLARQAVDAPDRAHREARMYAAVHMVPGALLTGLLAVEAEAVVTVIYGTAYAPAIGLLRMLAPAVLFNYAICGYTNCLIPYGKDRAMLAVVGVSAVVAIGGGLLLVPHMGAAGACVAVSLTDLAGWLVGMAAYRKTVGHHNLDIWLLPLAGMAATAVVCLGLQAVGVPWPLRIALGIAAYAPFGVRTIKEVLR